MAGGTGGHVFPALAVAHCLRERGAELHWLGTSAGIEARLVPAAEIPLHTLNVAGLRGKGLRNRLVGVVGLVRALWQAVATVHRLKPDVVLGFGGYASGPGGVAARLLRKPLVIHEQNAVAGTTNRILARIATRVLEAFPGTLSSYAVCTGNPVREDIARLPAPDERGVGQHQPLRLLVLGGSLGALAINSLVPAALAQLVPDQRPLVRHQCGEKHLETTLQGYRDAGVTAEVQPFVEDMAEAYGWADFVICRAGALTVSELATAGVGALLVPFPAAIDDHQTANARWLADKGAALLVQQQDLDADGLAQTLSRLLAEPRQLADMANRARTLARADATRQVAIACEEVMK